ncbi:MULTISPECIES: hypothetical protein [unclassified Pseudomonas]|uniref:hypothetical protein n=1 Tax=unclassified Pseudomonas TaxID=196821 RepID=UPI0025F66143|nr:MULTISPECIES: hypothetical protein [unclassified Pseudomonas]
MDRHDYEKAEMIRFTASSTTPKDSQDRQKTFLLGSRTGVSGLNSEVLPPILPPVASGARAITIGDF